MNCLCTEKKAKPDPSGIKQGGIGDCYVLSSVEAVMHVYGPGYIQNMLEQQGKNSFVVKFPGAGPVKVRLTEAEIAQGNDDPGNGVWLQVFGIAMDKLRKKQIWRARAYRAGIGARHIRSPFRFAYEKPFLYHK